LAEFHQENQSVVNQYNAEYISLTPQFQGEVSLMVTAMTTPSRTNSQLLSKIPNDRRLRYESEIREDRVIITPIMPYLAKLAADGLVSGLDSRVSTYFDWGYPNLDVRVVNNSPNTISIVQAVFQVDESRPDPSAVLVVQDNRSTLFQVNIVNDGWGPMMNSRILYKVINFDEDPGPPENYPDRVEVGEIADSYALDVSDPLSRIGVDMSVLKALITSGPGTPYIADAEVARALGRFQHGAALAVGLVKFDDHDVEGTERHHCIEFETPVPLLRPGYGIPTPPRFQYSTEFLVEGRNYEVRAPIAQAMTPGEPDRFNVSIGVARSSRHQFRMRAILSTGESIPSRPVVLNAFVPRRQGFGSRKVDVPQ